MSLLNDVLRDLDSSRSTNPAATPLHRGAGGSPTRRPLILPMLAVVAVVYLCLVELNLLGLFPRATALNQNLPQPLAIDSRWLARAEEIKAKQAQLRMQQDRVLALSVPEDSGAADSHHPERHKAVQAAPLVGTATKDLVAEPTAQASTVGPGPAPATAASPLHQTVGLEPQAEPHATQTGLSRASAPMTVAVSLTDQDAQFAARLLAEDWRRWQMDARTWLTQGAEYEHTALALLERYAAMGAVDELHWLEEQLALRQSGLQTLVRARLAWIDRQPEAAVAELQTLTYTGAAEQVRLRLLGGWLQQMRLYPNAAEAFDALVKLDRASAADWLGLAVALDAQHRAQEALAAYRRADLAKHPQHKINMFIQQRIRELSSLAPGR